METPRMRPVPTRLPASRANTTPAMPTYSQFFPMHPSFFPPSWYGPWGQFGPPMTPSMGALPAPGDWVENDGQATPGPSTSKALVPLPKATPRDTPSSYPTPPCDDPNYPPPGIHPYLYNDECPVTWDVRENLIHKARRAGGERLSSIALKANAINAGGLNHTTMRILVGDETFPWTITIRRDIGITVGDVLTEIGHMLDKEVTDAERFIAAPERLVTAESSRMENEGTGAIRTREKGDVIRRVDWLGKKTRFRGLQHSSSKQFESLVRRRVHAHDKPNSWVMVLDDRE